MDMLPDKELESPEPGDESRETPPADGPEEGSASQPEPPNQEGIAPETPPVEASAASDQGPHRPSFDEAVGAMRQSLREDETKEQKGFGAGVKRMVQRIFRRKTAPLPEVAESRLDEFAIPETPRATQAVPPAQAVSDAASEAEVAAPEAAAEPERPPTEAGEFHSLVEKKMGGALPGMESLEPLVPEPPVASEDDALDFLAPGQTHLKQQQPEEAEASGQSILQSIRGEEPTEPQEVSSMRQAALEDYVVAPAEEEEEEAAPLPRRLRRGWRDMRPIDRTLLTGALAIVAVAFVGTSAYAVYKSVVPTATPVPVTPTTSVTPIPISLSLPGGWVFPLKTGRVDSDGIWNPTGAEWLQGTEICRWVSLPWTVQLEAVLRTLKADDPIQLTMSNNASITFKVKSIQQAKTAQEIQSLAPTTPSLLLILSKSDSPSRWVVTAEP